MTQEYCNVCGHPISSDESIARGYGSECAAAITKAYYELLNKDNDASLKYNWIIEVELVKSLFLDTFKTTKFRSEFKKSFYSSMQNAERVSRKQMDIMIKELDYKHLSVSREVIYNARQAFFEEWCSDKKITRAAIEIARREVRKNK